MPPGAATPPAASPRGSPGSSPFKAAPGAAPPSQQPAAVLAEQAALLLQQQGRVGEAQALLAQALRKCPASDTQAAARIIDLLLEADRELQVTPTHSRAGSEADQLEDAAAAAAGASADGELRQAVAALAAGEERRALQLLQRAQVACPEDLPELKRRIGLYMQIVQCKR